MPHLLRLSSGSQQARAWPQMGICSPSLGLKEPQMLDVSFLF